MLRVNKLAAVDLLEEFSCLLGAKVGIQIDHSHSSELNNAFSGNLFPSFD